MNFSDYVTLSFKSIIRRKDRFFLTLISILIGVISVIIISTIGISGEKAVSLELDKLGLNGISVKSKNFSLTTDDAKQLKNILGNDYYVSTTAREITEGTYNNKKLSIAMWGGEEDILNILNLQLIYGKGIRKKDLDSEKCVTVLTKNASKKIFDNANPIGKKITVNAPTGDYEFTVVGIVNNSNLYDMVSENMPLFFYVPSTVFSKIFGRHNIGDISIVDKNKKDIKGLGKTIVSILEKEKNTSDNIYFENMNMYKNSLKNIAGIVTLIITLIGAVSLVVGGISVMNTMLVNVSERKKEIGVKKALGATNFTIMSEFFSESLIIVLISCILGIGFGIGISYIIVFLCRIDFCINVNVIFNIVIFSLITGGIFGIYPAYQASKLDPVSALGG